MLKKTKDYISFAMDEESLKIVHVRVSDASIEIAHVFKRNIKGLLEEDLNNEVKAGIKECHVKDPVTICVVPSQVTTSKNIEIPSLDPEEIKSIIDLQAGRHTPYSKEEIVLGYLEVGVYQRNYSKVLLVIANRNTIKRHMDVLAQGGLRTDRALFIPEAIARFYSRLLKLKEKENPVGILDVGRHTTDFIIAFKGTVISCRSIPLGITQLKGADAAAAREKFIHEIKSSLDSYQNEDIEKPPEGFILTSNDPVIAELQPVLKDTLKIYISTVSYLDHVKVQPPIAKLLAEGDDDPLLYMVAPAAACEEASLDLIPEEVKMQKAIQKQGREVIKFGVLTLVLLVLISGVFFTKIYFKGAVVDNLRSDYAKEHDQVTELEDVAAKTQIIKNFLDQRLTSLEVIKTLYGLLPDEIYLATLEMDDKGAITIKGTSESMSLVFALVSALEDSDLFKSVKTKSTNAKKERGKDVAAFEIAFKLESAADDTEEAVAQQAPPKGE